MANLAKMTRINSSDSKVSATSYKHIIKCNPIIKFQDIKQESLFYLEKKRVEALESKNIKLQAINLDIPIIKLRNNTDPNEIIKSSGNFDISSKNKQEILDDEEPYYFNEKTVKKNNLIAEKENDEYNDNIDEEILKTNILLRFSLKQKGLGEIFKGELIDFYKTQDNILLIVLLLLYLSKLIGMIFLGSDTIFLDKNLSYKGIIVFRAVFLLLIFLVLLCKNLFLHSKWFKSMLVLSFYVGFSANLAFSFGVLNSNCHEIETIELMSLYMIYLNMSVVYFLDGLVAFIGIFIVKLFGLGMGKNLFFFQNIILLMFCCVLMMQAYRRMTKLITNFNNINVTSFRQNQQKKLLMHLLPKHVNFYRFLL